MSRLMRMGVGVGAVLVMMLTAGAMASAGKVSPAASANIYGFQYPSPTTATVSGYLASSLSSPVSYGVDYGPASPGEFCNTQTPGLTVIDTGTLGAKTFGPASLPISGLSPGHTYCAAIVIIVNGAVEIADSSVFDDFIAGAPSVTVDQSTKPEGSRAEQLDGTVFPVGLPTSYEVLWSGGESSFCETPYPTAGTHHTAARNLAAGATEQRVSVRIGGLQAGHQYCMGIEAINAAGRTVVPVGDQYGGAIVTAGDPSVSTGSASDITATSAHLALTVDDDEDHSAYAEVAWTPDVGLDCKSDGRLGYFSGKHYAVSRRRLPPSAATEHIVALTGAGGKLKPHTRYCYAGMLLTNEPVLDNKFGKIRFFTTPR